MRRDWLAYLVLIFLLGALGGFAWLTHHPESVLLARAREWPVLGPLAERFQDRYTPQRPMPRTEPPAAVEPILERVLEANAAEERLVELQGTVWVGEGTRVFTDPDPVAEVSETLGAVVMLPYFERRGDWYKVHRASGFAWVYLEGYDSLPPILGSGLEPVVPLPPRSPSPERLSAGMDLLGLSGSTGRLGPWILYSDSPDTELVELCDRVASELEAVYRQRYGLELVGEAAEAILLFQGAEEFLLFKDQESTPVEPWAAGFTSKGIVALYAGSWPSTVVCGRVVHELTHLLNRRGIGPALPPWLEEGLASDLSHAKIDELGRLHPGTIGGETLRMGESLFQVGGLAEVRGLQDALEVGEVTSFEELTELDSEAFYTAEQVNLHYSLSLFWVRYLLSDESGPLAGGFRSFLAALARGEPLTRDLLLEHLGVGWDELERDFRVWVATLEPPGRIDTGTVSVGR
ncbi:MAG: hypothetical protein EP299_11010 [Acidobacteria bacterium]|nr:MAG: hypothetical protein EP299_11010 [Acidobacteriota bacterium]